MTPRARRLDAREAERVLEGLGALGLGQVQRPAQVQRWPPGPSFVLASEDEPTALLRLGESEPGEGYHREHVRFLHGLGAGPALTELTIAVVAGCEERLRLEAEAPYGGVGAAAWTAACQAAGLKREVLLPAAWRAAPGEAAVALELWGRPGLKRRGEAPTSQPPPGASTASKPPAPRAARASLVAGLRVLVHGESTRAGLRVFLDRLVPGRSYPPGVFLSDAERIETRRPGDLAADWVLALSEEGRVAGGVVLAPDPRPERRHVRRLHVDVLPEFRGCGLATRLLVAAREHARDLGLEGLEADPRGGHAAVLAALRRAGLLDCGRQEGAWRMRTASESWDEDVVLLSDTTLQGEP